MDLYGQIVIKRDSGIGMASGAINDVSAEQARQMAEEVKKTTD